MLKGRRLRGPPYSSEESAAICSYVLKKLDQGQQYFYPGSHATWQRALAEGLLPNRTVGGLRFYFRVYIMPNLHTIVTDPADAERLSNSLRYTHRPNRALLRLARAKFKSIRTATARPVVVEKVIKLRNSKYCVENRMNFVKNSKNLTGENQEKCRYKKKVKGKIGRGFCYSQDELFEMVEFVAKKLRDWPKDKFDEMPGSQILKIWQLAKEEGLFPQHTPNGLLATFRLKILPNLHKFTKKREDVDLIQSNLLKLRIGAPRGSQPKIQNAGRYKEIKKNPPVCRARGVGSKHRAFYSHEESLAMCSYVLRKLDSGQQYFYAGSLNAWRQATAEGLLPYRSPDGLKHHFCNKIRPNLEKFVKDPNDLERLKAYLSFTFHNTKEKQETSNIFDQIAPKSTLSTFSDRADHRDHVITGAHVETMSDDDVQNDDDDAPSLSANSRFWKNPEKSSHFHNGTSKQIGGESSKSPAEKISSYKTLRNENVQLKQALAAEQREKLSNYRLIENLTRQLDYHQRETVRRQKDCYQLKSRSIELENEIVQLNIRLSTYANYLPYLPRNL